MSSSLTKDRFNRFKRYLEEEEDITIEVDTSYYEQAKTPRQDRIMNGQAGADSYIILYKDTKDSNYDMLSSLLIHEFGHVINWRDLGRSKHTEKEAWEVGILNTPAEFHPPTLLEDCEICLSSYDILVDEEWKTEMRNSINTI